MFLQLSWLVLVFEEDISIWWFAYFLFISSRGIKNKKKIKSSVSQKKKKKERERERWWEKMERQKKLKWVRK